MRTEIMDFSSSLSVPAYHHTQMTDCRPQVVLGLSAVLVAGSRLVVLVMHRWYKAWKYTTDSIRRQLLVSCVLW
jgi:hypothetical protein